jgi:phosphonate transport system ATP-binding protein
MLEVKHLTKVYKDGTVALKDVSFTVQDGEFLVIIGLSGASLLSCVVSTG